MPSGTLGKAPSNSMLLKPDKEFIEFYSSFRHLRLIPVSNHPRAWRLPLKRNFALLHARRSGHDRILIMDDDIEMDLEVLKRSSGGLRKFSVVSFPSVDFPDKSSVGYIARLLGKDEDIFISGAALLVDVKRTFAFFPNVYNEDWLFFRQVGWAHIAFGGHLNQRLYNPINKVRAKFQAFGDVVAEGLVSLDLATPKSADVYSTSWWQQVKRNRLSFIQSLQAMVVAKKKPKAWLATLGMAAAALAEIDTNRIPTFLKAVEADAILWREFLNRQGN